MTSGRLGDYLAQMRTATADAISFVEGMRKDEFLADKRTQHAVVMSIIILGEAATRIMENDPQFVAAHPQIPWQSMRGMRNRIAHGYFETNFDVVWETVCTALPELSVKLSNLRED
jgi:uncharacterized protein with HEPN domain